MSEKLRYVEPEGYFTKKMLEILDGKKGKILGKTEKEPAEKEDNASKEER